MGHPNALGALILMLLPLSVLSYLYSNDRWMKSCAILASVVSLVALVVTYSRSAWLALFVGMGTVLLITVIDVLRVRRFADKGRLLRGAGIVVVFLFFAFLSFSDSIARRLFQDDYGAARSRIPMMVDAVEVIKSNYILGGGLNNYPQIISRYDVTGIHRESSPTIVHNLFLLIAAESGVFCLAVFLFFIYRVLREGNIRVHERKSRLSEVLVVGSKLGIILLLVFALFDPAYRAYPGLQRVFWLLCGLIVGLNAAVSLDSRS